MIKKLTMKKLFLTGIAVLFLVTGTAHAQSSFPFPRYVYTFRPPPEYDKPYTGELTIKHVSTDELKMVCWEPGRACTHTDMFNRSCIIYILDDPALLLSGVDPDEVMRHEIRHCNGWPKDHRGGKEEWMLK